MSYPLLDPREVGDIDWARYPWRGWSPVGTYTGDPRSGYVAPWVTGTGVYGRTFKACG
jgi:hypothetical protein